MKNNPFHPNVSNFNNVLCPLCNKNVLCIVRAVRLIFRLFPNLSTVVRRLLAVPASSAPSEGSFSAARHSGHHSVFEEQF